MNCETPRQCGHPTGVYRKCLVCQERADRFDRQAFADSRKAQADARATAIQAAGKTSTK